MHVTTTDKRMGIGRLKIRVKTYVGGNKMADDRSSIPLIGFVMIICLSKFL